MTGTKWNERRWIFGLAAIGLMLGACADDSSGDDEPAPGPSASQSSDSPAASVPTRQQDKQIIEAALLTPADLGKPWIEPESVNEVDDAGKSDSLRCNNFTAVLKAAEARKGVEQKRNMTEGAEPGAAILGVRATTIEADATETWRTAQRRALAPCTTFEQDLLLAVQTPVKDVSVEGSDEALGAIVRVYSDDSKSELLYVRHVLVARTGRAIVYMEHAYVQPSSDPEGSDTSAIVGFMNKQVVRLEAEAAELAGATEPDE